MELLTYSRQDAFKTCRRKELLAYEMRIRPKFDAKALRMGSAYHASLEILGNSDDLTAAVESIYNAYSDPAPTIIDLSSWWYERETLVRLCCGYKWRWSNQTIKFVANEQVFRLPLVNPSTGMPSRTFELSGKIDGIIELEDGRLAIMEHKLLGEDISSEAHLWRRLRRDSQVSIYVIAARKLGYQVSTVIYNVSRKPAIKPEVVPFLDADGMKIVMDAYGKRVKTTTGSWRQTGSADLGYVLQCRPMTPQEWGDKLNGDIATRPDFYFQRVEIPRTDDELHDVEAELWDIAKSIREAQLQGHWYRTVNRNTCQFCPYDPICDHKELEELPEGFEVVSEVHPELYERLTNAKPSTTGELAGATCATCATFSSAATTSATAAVTSSSPGKEWSGNHQNFEA